MPRGKSTRTRAARVETSDQPARRARRTPAERPQTPDSQEAARVRNEVSGLPPFVGGSTGTHGAKAGEPSGRTVVILHGAVGGHARGAIVHESELGDASQVQRLLDLEAVAWHGEAEFDDSDDEEEVEELDQQPEEAPVRSEPVRRARRTPAEAPASSESTTPSLADDALSVSPDSQDDAKSSSEDHQGD